MNFESNVLKDNFIQQWIPLSNYDYMLTYEHTQNKLYRRLKASFGFISSTASGVIFNSQIDFYRIRFPLILSYTIHDTQAYLLITTTVLCTNWEIEMENERERVHEWNGGKPNNASESERIMERAGENRINMRKLLLRWN